MGMEPTGHRLEMHSTDIWLGNDGYAVEHWDNVTGMEFLQGWLTSRPTRCRCRVTLDALDRRARRPDRFFVGVITDLRLDAESFCAKVFVERPASGVHTKSHWTLDIPSGFGISRYISEQEAQQRGARGEELSQPLGNQWRLTYHRFSCRSSDHFMLARQVRERFQDLSVRPRGASAVPVDSRPFSASSPGTAV